MATTYLGNLAVIEACPNGDLLPRPDLGHRITTYVTSDADASSISSREIKDTWRLHSTDKPAWVESTNITLAGLLAELFECPIGRPDSWQEGNFDGGHPHQ